MKVSRTNLLVAAVVLGTILLALFGIVSRDHSSQVAVAKLRVGIIPITDGAQVFIAKHSGLFSREGLDVEIIPMAGGAVILQALSAGSIDVAFSNLASAVFFEKNAGSLHALAGGTRMDPTHSEAGLVVREESGIKTLAELRGKTIAVNTLRNIVDLAVLRALRLKGVSSNEIKLVELPFKDMESALRTKNIDAAALPEPILTRAMRNGGLRNLGDHFSLAFGELYSTGYFTLPNNAGKQPKSFERFNAAIKEATPIANAYGDAAVDAISAETKLGPQDLKSAGRPEYVTELPASAIADMRTWMKEEGFLDR